MTDPTPTLSSTPAAPIDKASASGAVAIATALFSIYLAQHPTSVIAQALHSAWPSITDALPYVIGGIASLYTWASHGPPRLKALFGIKPHPTTTEAP